MQKLIDCAIWWVRVGGARGQKVAWTHCLGGRYPLLESYRSMQVGFLKWDWMDSAQEWGRVMYKPQMKVRVSFCGSRRSLQRSTKNSRFNLLQIGQQLVRSELSQEFVLWRGLFDMCRPEADILQRLRK